MKKKIYIKPYNNYIIFTMKIKINTIFDNESKNPLKKKREIFPINFHIFSLINYNIFLQLYKS